MKDFIIALAFMALALSCGRKEEKPKKAPTQECVCQDCSCDLEGKCECASCDCEKCVHDDADDDSHDEDEDECHDGSCDR